MPLPLHAAGVQSAARLQLILGQDNDLIFGIQSAVMRLHGATVETMNFAVQAHRDCAA